MAGGLARARDLLRLAFTGRGRRMWSVVTYRLYSNSVSVGLRRDLRAPCAAPPAAKRPFQVRPLTPDDHLAWLAGQEVGLSDRQGDVPLGPTSPARSGTG